MDEDVGSILGDMLGQLRLGQDNEAADCLSLVGLMRR